MARVFLTRAPIDLAEFFSISVPPESGALATFAGIVRNHHEGRAVKKIYYDCYEPLAQKELGKICEEVSQRFPVQKIWLKHRIHELQVGEVAVAIAVVSAHRDEAFQACRLIIDQIKIRVPIWKQEFYQDGSVAWVGCQH